MSGEKHDLQRQADRARARSRRSVTSYLVILFAAAFVLLLMSYFMQQRTNEALLDNLQQSSSSAAETLEALIADRDRLKDEAVALEERIEELEEQLEAQQSEREGLERANALLQGENDSLVYTLESTAQAMDWFWQINEAYVRGRNALARELIESINAAGLVEYLPRESATDNERFSPYERYQEIYDALY